MDNFRIVKAFRMFTGKKMVNDYWVVFVFEIYYGFRIVDDFSTIFRKGMANDYWIVSVFRIACV